MTNGEDISGWGKFLIALLALGAIVFGIAVPSFVESLPIYPSWLRWVLYFLILAANVFPIYRLTKVSDDWGLGTKELLKKYWVYTLPYIATGILVIYTIRGIILGDISTPASMNPILLNMVIFAQTL